MVKTTLVPGQTLHGFRVERIVPLAELDSLGLELKHERTGCRLFHIANEDAENAFAFTFRTPPRTSDGVAHILEHSVLCGSAAFPLKDPFFTLVKGSMNTYLNAWTFPDKTVYPAASVHPTDYLNIMEVYGDAVFFPLLRPEAFLQEAWRLAPADATVPDGPLEASGVVFNEMKGNYSSQSSIVGEWTYRALFPDTPYSVDSGGEPAAILDLTHAGLKEFHRAYYHPSNCRILLYGNLPTAVQLEFLDRRFLSRFEKLDVDSTLPLQKTWPAPRRVEKKYPVRPGEDLAQKTEVIVSWLLPEATDPLQRTAFIVLDEILSGHPGSPLRRALVESGLGQDYGSAVGLETSLRQLAYSTGLRGTEAAAAGKIETLALETMRALVRDGIPSAILEASLRQVEFQAREISGGGTPWALKLFQRALAGWLHDAPPENTLLILPPLAALKARIAAEPRFLESMLDRWLVQNPHRNLLVATPDTAYMEKFEGEIAAAAQKKAAALDGSARAALLKNLEALERFQETPDSEEALATIPFLKRSDLPTAVRRIASEDRVLSDGTPLTVTPEFSNGIVYGDLAFRVDGLPADLAPWLPLYGRAVTGSGLPGRHYADVQQSLALVSGGFYPLTEAAFDPSAKESKAFLIFRLKAREEYFPEALALVGDLLRHADFADAPRLHDILLETRNGLAAAVIPRGSQRAVLRAARHLSPAAARRELWEGVSQVEHLTTVRDRLAAGESDGRARLEAVRDWLFTFAPRAVGLTADRTACDRLSRTMDGVLAGFPKLTPAALAAAAPAPAPEKNEALLAATGVGFTAQAFRAAAFGTRENVMESALCRLLTSGLLHEKIRVMGGAYGAGAFTFVTEGLFCFSSYRDPRITGTFASFRDCLKTAADGAGSADDLDKAIISMVADDETPLRPGEKGFTAFRRRLLGISDAARQKNRDWVLGLEPRDLSGRARALLGPCDNGRKVVLTGREAWEKAKQEQPALDFTETELVL